jgi:hypothetical protein
VHDALKALLASANKSIVVAMYGYDRRLARRTGTGRRANCSPIPDDAPVTTATEPGDGGGRVM